MPNVEIDEAEYKRLTQLGQLADQIYRHPEGKMLLEKAQKAVQPNAPTPALDAYAAQTAPLEEIRKSITELTDLVTKDKADRETQAKIDGVGKMQDEAFTRLRSNSRYTDAGIERVKAIMAEKGILDPIDAAIIWERREPTPTIATPTGSNSVPLIEKLQTDQDASIKQLFDTRGESDFALNTLIKGALDEFRGGR
jgi:hypothetical protein